MIAVTNLSTVVTSADADLMVKACYGQLWYHVAPAWERKPTWVRFYADATQVPARTPTIAIIDNSDQANALGWHSVDSVGVPDGKVFAKTTLQNGAPVSAVLSHEVLELFLDSAVNLWADDGRGSEYAVECGDPVENDLYDYPVTRPDGVKVMVKVSNFATAKWFDPFGSVGPWDHLGLLRAPFTMTRGGYVTYRAGGATQQKFGDLYPAWKRETKRSPLARTARRLEAQR